MPQLYMITVPGLDVKSHWAVVHDRLLDAFGHVSDVLPTTMPSTLLIVYQGVPDADAWLRLVSETLLSRRLQTGARRRA
jgi:hypothetical protein